MGLAYSLAGSGGLPGRGRDDFRAGPILIKAAILFPYPYAGSHQLEMPFALRQVNAAVVIEEKDLTAKSWRRIFQGLFVLKTAAGRLRGISSLLPSSDADEKLADVVLGLAGKSKCKLFCKSFLFFQSFGLSFLHFVLCF